MHPHEPLESLPHKGDPMLTQSESEWSEQDQNVADARHRGDGSTGIPADNYGSDDLQRHDEGYQQGRGADGVRDADLRGTDLPDSDLRDSGDLRETDLRHTDMGDPGLREGGLSDSDLRDDDLRDDDLRGDTELRDGDVRDAGMRDADQRDEFAVGGMTDRATDAQRVDVNSDGRPAGDADGAPEELLAHDDVERYRDQWRQIQTAFVDDPRDAVQSADQLVNEVMTSLSSMFDEHKRNLEGQWQQQGEAETETLRVALRSYRSFFQQLLKV